MDGWSGKVMEFQRVLLILEASWNRLPPPPHTPQQGKLEEVRAGSHQPLRACNTLELDDFMIPPSPPVWQAALVFSEVTWPKQYGESRALVEEQQGQCGVMEKAED